jgi:hypothetical protein
LRKTEREGNDMEILVGVVEYVKRKIRTRYKENFRQSNTYKGTKASRKGRAVLE